MWVGRHVEAHSRDLDFVDSGERGASAVGADCLHCEVAAAAFLRHSAVEVDHSRCCCCVIIDQSSVAPVVLPVLDFLQQKYSQVGSLLLAGSQVLAAPCVVRIVLWVAFAESELA